MPPADSVKALLLTKTQFDICYVCATGTELHWCCTDEVANVSRPSEKATDDYHYEKFKKHVRRF